MRATLLLRHAPVRPRIYVWTSNSNRGRSCSLSSGTTLSVSAPQTASASVSVVREVREIRASRNTSCANERTVRPAGGLVVRGAHE
jgi:hypothetical protein